MTIPGVTPALSLRARALLGGVVWIVIAVGLSGFVLLSTFDEISERGFQEKLANQAGQVEALIRSGAFDDGVGAGDLARPFLPADSSTLLWQIEPPDGPPLLSPSLGEEMLAPPPALPIRTGPIAEYQRLRRQQDGLRYIARLQDGKQVQIVMRAVERRARGVGPGLETWKVSVAAPRAALSRDQLEFRRSLFGALIGLGASLVLAGAAQTGMALRPLVALRAAFLDYRMGGSRRIEGRYPSDIATLVDDLNELLDRNEEVIQRARRQAADLAHALKTPVAILRNDVSAPAEGAAAAREQRERMEGALLRIDSLIARYTARASIAGASAPAALCEVAPAVDGLGRVMAQVHRDAGLDFEARIPPDLKVRCAEEDLEELLGNLIDNAHKWAVGVVRVSAARDQGVAMIAVEDDGPGIPEEARQKALIAGGRLDEAVPGTGLGLAICSDILEAYGGTLQLATSELGGLAAVVRLPSPEPAATATRRR